LVKTRDVWSAIDVLGMPRDGKERWKGVARRCGLRVYDGKWSRYRNNRTRREVPWDEVEQVMTVAKPMLEVQTTDAETSDNDAPNFKSRAARSGTPLPMDRLALSDSEEDEDTSDDSDGSLSGETEHLSRRAASRSRDPKGRYASVPPTTNDREHVNQTLTLEHFDKEASRQEEHTLWQMLGIEPPTKDEEVKSDEDNEEDYEYNEKIITHPDGWRSWVNYHAEWEEFSAPVSPAEFAANEKPLTASPLLPPKALVQAASSSEDDIEGVRVADSSSGDDSDADTLRQRSQRRSKHKAQEAIELHARSAREYAALQSRASRLACSGEESHDNDDESSNAEENMPNRSPGASTRLPPITAPSDNNDSSDTDVDQPTQSIETRMPSEDESTESETDHPTQSIEEVGSKRSPVVVSDDDFSDSSDIEMDRPTRSIETGTKRPPALDSDDEMGEMDWDTFID
jgi:RNA polymerase I-specific transcription initiation factor RRN5